MATRRYKYNTHAYLDLSSRWFCRPIKLCQGSSTFLGLLKVYLTVCFY